MERLEKKCPKDGAAMYVSQNEALVTEFTCPVCGISRTHDQFRPEDNGGNTDDRRKCA